MASNQKKGNTSLIVGAIGGIACGWFVKNYLSTQQQLEEHRSLLQKVKDLQHKVYEDGKKRYDTLDSIKQDVNNHLS